MLHLYKYRMLTLRAEEGVRLYCVVGEYIYHKPIQKLRAEGGGLIIHHGLIICSLRYVYNSSVPEVHVCANTFPCCVHMQEI